jgi:hypothetical protein
VSCRGFATLFANGLNLFLKIDRNTVSAQTAQKT